MVQTLAESTLLSGHQAPVKLLSISPGGRYIASADTERQLKVWQDGQIVMEKNLRTWHDRFLALDRIRALTFGAEPNRLYVASGESVKGYDVPNSEEVWEHGRPPTWAFLITCPQSISVNSEGLLAAAYDDGHVETYGPTKTDWKDNDAPKSMAFLRDGTRIAGTDFVSVCIWNSFTGAKLAKYRPAHRKVYALAASRVADVIAVRSLYDVELWNTESGERVATTPSRPGLPILAFHPTREMLAIGDARGYSVVNFQGAEQVRVDCQGYSPLILTYAPDGSLLVGCSDSQIRIWKLPV